MAIDTATDSALSPNRALEQNNKHTAVTGLPEKLVTDDFARENDNNELLGKINDKLERVDEKLKLPKLKNAIADIAKATADYLKKIFSPEDEQTIFNAKKINISSLSNLLAVFANNPVLSKAILKGVSQSNFVQNQADGKLIDDAIDNLANYDAEKIKLTLENLISIYSKGKKLSFPNKAYASLETVLLLVSDVNFDQNLYTQINKIQAGVLEEGIWLKQDSEVDLEKEPEDVHAADVDSIDPSTTWGAIRMYFHDSPPLFKVFRDNFTMILNYIGIALNGMAVIATNSNVFSKEASKSIDNGSEWYSRYIVPFSFAWNGIEALVGNRLVEAATRIIPAISFWALPFYNFNTATGISSGVNYMLELVSNRLRKQKVKIPSHNMFENAKVIGGEFIQVFKDFFTNAKTDENWVQKVTSGALLGGSIGGFLFASKDRDTWLARLFGNLRNLGGFVGDYDLVTNRKYDVHKKVVGLSCGIASVLNTIMRWVNPELARTLNHISIAADDFGLTYWAQDSRRHNKVGKVKVPEKEPVARNLLKQLATN